MAHGLRVPAHFGIRTERYKLIFFYGCNPNGGGQTPTAWELYDLHQDPSEMDNRYSDPDYAELRDDLKRRLWQLREDLGETDADFPAIDSIVARERTMSR